MISTLIALPYEVARLPLTLADRTLAGRVAETSGPRVALDQAIGSADRLAGALLRNDALARRGTERLERSEKLLTAARLEQEAQARRQQASRTAASGRDGAARKRQEAQDRAASGLVEADAVEARGKKEAKARSARTAAQKKTAADKRAADQAASVRQRKGRVDSTAEAQKKKVQRAARSELDDARETKQSAAGARADAERLSKLAETKKQERKQD